MPIIEITNTSIAPWNETNPMRRSSQINALRQSFMNNTAIKRCLYNFIGLILEEIQNNLNINETLIYRDTARDLSLSKNCFPPIRRTFDRIWRDYIFPQPVFIYIDIDDEESIIGVLSDMVEFHMFYKNLRQLKSEDIYNYKYCVILASINIINKILAIHGEFNICPISYVSIGNHSSKFIFSRIGRLHKISIRADIFLHLINIIPIFGTNLERGSYNYFWDYLYNIYNNYIISSFDRIKPLLTEEYQNRTDDKKSFISKKQIISIIEKSYITDNVLYSIYDIMQFVNNE